MDKKNIRIIFDKKRAKSGVIVTIKEFNRLMEELEDFEDLASVYEVEAKALKPIPYEVIKAELYGNALKK